MSAERFATFIAQRSEFHLFFFDIFEHKDRIEFKFYDESQENSC